MVREGYKQTEVGVIPEDWDVRAVGDICDFIVPGRNKPRIFKGDIPWITTPDLENGRGVSESKLGLFVSRDEAKSVGSKIVPNGAVLMSCVGELGIVAFVEREIVINQQLHAFIPTSVIDPLFLLNALQSKKNFMLSIATLTAVPYLNKDNCNSIPIPLPSLPEQRSIAQALADVDAMISALDKLITKKRAIKTATMQQLFTGRKRLPGFGEGKGYKETAIGAIPEDWNVRALGNVGKFKNGINKGSEAFGHGSPFVNLMDVFSISSISEVKHLGLMNSNDAEKKAYDLKEGDVLFIRSSVKPSGVGLTTIVTKDLPNSVYSGFLIRFRDDGNMETAFKKYCFSEEKFRKRVIASSTVSANTNINQDNLKQLSLAYPESLAEQHAIATVLSDMDAEIAALETRLAKTQALKQGMMQALLTGKVRLI